MLQFSPSVVSLHIAQLEERLGFALLYRTTRRLSLTNEGERLCEKVRMMPDAVEEELEDLSAKSGEPEGKIRLSLPSVLSHSPLIDKIAAFVTKNPKIRPVMDFTDEKRDLVKDGFDLAFRMSPKRKRAQNRKSIMTVRRLVIAAQSFLDKHGYAEAFEDLNSYRWVSLSPTRMVIQTLKKEGHPDVNLRPQYFISANEAYAVSGPVKAGAGVGIVPDILVEKDISEGKLVILFPEWQPGRLDVFAEWPMNAPEKGLARLLVSEL